MRARTAIAVTAALFLVGASGCKKDPPPSVPAQAETTRPDPIAIDAAVAPTPTAPPSSYTCERHRDCAVSCEGPDDCCGELCQCTRPYHRAELDALRAGNRAHCGKGGRDCPVARCPAPTTERVPRCIQGQCAAAEVPRYLARHEYTCKTASDCVVATAIPNDCCGQKCFASNVYHKDQLAEIRTVNDQRCTSQERDECPQAKCAKPSTRTTAVCVEGSCKPKQVPW